MILLWCVWAGVAFIVLCTRLRRRWITRPLLRWFQRQQPPLTPSEEEALQAGGTWWETELLMGQPHWERLLRHPFFPLTQEETAFLEQEVNTLCGLLDHWKIHLDNDLPKEAWEYIKTKKFWGLIIDKEYGGLGFSAVAHSAIITKIASRSVSAAISVMVPNSLGPAEFLMHYGTLEQKKYYLPRLACGEEIGCFALTAVEAGSDASAIADTGIVCKEWYQGKEVLGVRLNWQKRYITLAPIATLIALAFKMQDPDHWLGEQEDIGITVALVQARAPGVEVGARHWPLHLAFLNGPVRGKNVFVPLDHLLGGTAGAGQGWRMMMECLSLGRGISLPALSTGILQLCFLTSGAYAQIRQQFARPIGEFEGVAEALAHLGGYTYLCEATRVLTTQAVAEGARPTIASAIAKHHMTELARKGVNHAMDIHGGRAIQIGPRNYLSSFYAAVPIGITVEGANILTRNLIIYGQGMVRCHPYLGAELQACQQPDEAARLKAWDPLFLSHVGYFLSRFCRAFFYGITGGHWVGVGEKSRTTKYLRQMTRMSNALALMTDVTLLCVGASIKWKESLSARLGDVLSHLYMACAVVKLYGDSGKRAGDWPFAEWTLNYCLAAIQRAWDDFFVNFPSRWVARMMCFILFPWGRCYFSPSDAMSMAVAKSLQQTSSIRERLTQYCYRGNHSDAVGRVEEAFRYLEKIKPLLNKLKSAHKPLIRYNTLRDRIQGAFELGLLSVEERELLQPFADLYWEALQVDEFHFEEGQKT
ncbi:MAG: acyl-CoA dehydrogenase [Coxiella sp. RIFCSPHIGHO2_12_FULL_44_14]|nr:MAG: acyl-CoA dehydrogenase [Coxiella sp. RIFCSPHIGHO2_12_FULL_44_14]